jgi:chaperonin GroES
MIKPLHDQVLIKIEKEEEEDERVTKGGIILTGEAKQQAKKEPDTGEVLAVGPGRLGMNGNEIPVSVKAGDTVYFAKYAGHVAEENEDFDLILVGERDILGIQ